MRERRQAPTICDHVQRPLILRLSHILVQSGVIFTAERRESIKQSTRTKQPIDTVTAESKGL
jgi:hypothetical protein